MDKKDLDKFSKFVDALSAVKKQEYRKAVTLQDFVSALSYLENGSVQKDVAHRFNPGDWIVYHEWLSDEEPETLQVEKFCDGNYRFSDGSVMEVEKEKFMKPWSIYSAKDKDILLTSDKRPFMEDEKKPVEDNHNEFEKMIEKDLIKFGDAVTLDRDGIRDFARKYFELGKYVELVHL